jgi:hypothetical protein
VSLNFLVGLVKKPLIIKARVNARKESAKIRNRKMQKKVHFLEQYICSFDYNFLFYLHTTLSNVYYLGSADTGYDM